MVSYIDIDGLVSTTHNTVNRLFSYKNGWDALMLYFRYIQQRKQQENNQTYSNDIFMMKATGWSKDKFYKVKKILVDLKFIELIQSFDENGKFRMTYVKVNFIIETNPSIEVDGVLNSRSPWFTESVKSDTNTLVSKVNTLVVKEKQDTGGNKKWNVENWNEEIILEQLKKYTPWTTRFCFFSALLENKEQILCQLEKKDMDAIEKKLWEFRTKLWDEKSRIELESFWEHHRVEKSQIKSIILRLNTWLKIATKLK